MAVPTKQSVFYLQITLFLVTSIYGFNTENHNLLAIPGIESNLERPLLYHERVKRDVATLELQTRIKENDTGAIFQLEEEPQFTSESHRFVLTSATVPGLFAVNEASGSVYLENNKRIDYEDGDQRSMQLTINATNINNASAVTEITLTITVTDINDEPPVFTNRPYPYQATVGIYTPEAQKVYELIAEDPDTSSDVTYRIFSGAEDKFTLKTENVVRNGANVKVGSIYTKGRAQFETGRDYTLICVASDENGDPVQTSFATVYIKVGSRPPQFYEDVFRGQVTENNRIGQPINGEFKVEVRGFQERPVTYQLLDEANATSSVFSIDSDGTVKAQQVLDYESKPWELRPPIYELTVVATEAVTNLQSTAKLSVEVLDVNDNSPVFDYGVYSTKHPENLPMDASVLEVTARDRDSGANGEMIYTVDHEYFHVETVNRSAGSRGPEYVGMIRVKKRLDYDSLQGHVYSLTVTATDKGNPAASGTANVKVFMTNINDEPPEIRPRNQILNLRDDAKAGHQIAVIQARNLDGDQIKYYFSPRRPTFEIFRIDEVSGLISLFESIPTDKHKYVLNITAVDDGSCCGGTSQLSSEAQVIVEIVDINTRKPTFPNCTSYKSAIIIENQPAGTSIIQVEAVDADRGRNGEVTYSILRAEGQTQVDFQIDGTGLITSAIPFDRETQSRYFVTVQGTDQGVPPLEGFCTFPVQIADANDNPPTFPKHTSFATTITERYKIDQSITTVRADDADMDINADITYSLVDSSDGYFRIDASTGIIYLSRDLESKKDFNMTVMAKDKGSPPLNSTVRVTVRVSDSTSEPPTWGNYNPETKYSVNETADIGYVIAKFNATSNTVDKSVLFSLIDSDGKTVQIVRPFRIKPENNTVDLTVFSSMDYNVKNSYKLRLRVANRELLTSEIHPVIELRDTNNKIPFFRALNYAGYYPGSLRENVTTTQNVIIIKAYDDDPTERFRELSFEIVPQNGTEKFKIRKIDDSTAVLTTNAEFDREKTKKLFVDVRVKDGAPSSRPDALQGQPNTAIATVHIIITDTNDNPPYFERSYNASVSEDAPVQQSILTVDAKDADDAAELIYSITEGDPQDAFGIHAQNGTIYVGRQLDFETGQHVYNLTITVSDGVFSSSTTASIYVLDANDNSPVFNTNPYVIDTVTEEETPSDKLLLVKVSATDADVNRPTNIRYSLIGYGTSPPNRYFEIEADSGNLYLLTSLDRDRPNGRAVYQFNVRAQDEVESPLYGYASVQVIPRDINDNAPFFISKLVGSVPEHSTLGTLVMTVVAKDYDEGENSEIRYDIFKDPTDPSEDTFVIDADTGEIRTNTNNLDRETTPSYQLKVKASDRGSPPQSTTATITIKLEDINDQRPMFERQLYKVTMEEAQTSETIAHVKATDKDTGKNAELIYSLVNYPDNFVIETVNNEGFIVAKSVDYEDVNQRFFNLTVNAADPDYFATAYVEVTVLDSNDNAPVFVNNIIEVEKPEDTEIGTFLAHFSANDADSGPRAEFAFSIDRKTDPDRLFGIDDFGNVTINKMMDREKRPRHDVHILAIDKGEPPQTGTATLIVKVTDINDNYPIFAEDYRPKVMEGAKFPELVVDISAKDRDNDPFGAPFGFAEIPCTDGTENCKSFTFEFIQGGDGGKGSAIISTKKTFDREEMKFYYLPIVMWDMRGTRDPRAMTGTNTLTIEIGDINDNDHAPGHQEIFVYNYKGMFGPMEIGTVYATDPDDWDVVDKTFTMTGTNKYMLEYFSVDKESGKITMQKGVPTYKPHTFTVDVYDRVRDVSAKCTVRVQIQDITEEAVLKSGSIRLKGITAEDFVKRPKAAGSDITAYEASKYDKFRTFLAAMLQVPLENVDILSVQNKDEFTDVRFSAHGSPYYSASKMNSIVALNRAKMEYDVGVQIEQVPIDECAEEMFEGGCYNFLNVTEKPALVNSNGTSFVGVEMFVQAMEGCRSDFYPGTDQCTADYCYNGGTCRQDDWGELHCQCPPGQGFNGPRCQGTHHSFDGKSYALYDPLEQCENSRTSLYFITNEENGLILYNGPTADPEPNSEEPTDFISLELSGGYPKLRINLGSGVLELYVNGRDQNGIAKVPKLSDGKWHRIDIIKHGRDVEMNVDHCDTSDIGPDGTVRDDKMCRQSGITPGENKFLNVRTLLQIGGRFREPSYPTGIMPTKFDGCVKKLEHNNKLYDLTVSGKTDPGYPSGKNTCEREDVICGGKCGDNGICESTWLPDTATCVCKPGYMGDKCSEEATTKDLDKDSFLQWRLKDSFFSTINVRKLKMNIMFRTRDPDGVLWTVSNTTNNMFTTLQVLNRKLTLTYNLGDGMRNLELYNRVVDNGAWHSVVVERNGREFILKMDNGEGPNYNFTYGFPNDKQHMLIENSVFAGATVSFEGARSDVASDLNETCVRDVRMDDGWFPMEMTENSKSSAATLVESKNVKDGCTRDDCLNANCPPGLICHPLWGIYDCRCPPYFVKDPSGICIEKDYCINHRCFGKAQCVINHEYPRNYYCKCVGEWEGDLCDRPIVAALQGGMTPRAIAITIVAFVLLLVLALLLVFLVTCRRYKSDDKNVVEVDIDDDLRENVIYYDEEGAGEEDQDGYNIDMLRKPNDNRETLPRREIPLGSRPDYGSGPRGHSPRDSRDAPRNRPPGVGDFINDRLGDADDDKDAPPHDTKKEYVYEGEGSDAGTLSSLNTTSTGSEQDYDYLNDWGPKFAKLADMYGAGQGGGEEDV